VKAALFTKLHHLAAISTGTNEVDEDNKSISENSTKKLFSF